MLDGDAGVATANGGSGDVTVLIGRREPFAGSWPTKFDADGELTLFDFVAFQNAFDV